MPPARGRHRTQPPPEVTAEGPNATRRRDGLRSPSSLAAHVSVQDLGGYSLGTQPPGELLRHRGAAVLAAGATHRDGGETLALLQVTRRDHLEQLGEVFEEGLGTVLAQHVVPDRLAEAGWGPQLRDPVRVRQEPDVEDHVGIDRYAVLESEGDQRDPKPVFGFTAVRVGDPRRKLVHVERRRVDHQVSGRAQGGQRLPFTGDAVEETTITLQRVRPPYGLLPADDHVVGRFQVQDLGQRARRREIAEHRRQLLEELPSAHVEHHRKASQSHFARLGADLRQHAGRQVVHHIPAEVLQRVGRCRPTGPRHAGHDDQPKLGRRWLKRRWLSHGDDYPCCLQVTVELDRGDFTRRGVDRFALRQRLQRLLDTDRGLRAEARHSGDLLDGCGTQLLQRTEVVEQELSADLTQARHLIQNRLDHRLTAPFPMVGDSEAVRLVPQSLEEIKALTRAWQDDRVVAVRQPHFLQALRQPTQGNVGDAELVQRPGCGCDLGRTAVDDHQGRSVGKLARSARCRIDQQRPSLSVFSALAAREGSAVVQKAPKPAGDDFVHRRDIVLAVDVPDDEATVLTLPWQPVFEDHHRGHHLRALQVGDVEALDPQRRRGQIERLPELFESPIAGGQITGPRRLVPNQRLSGIPGDRVHQRPLVTPVRHLDLDCRTAAFGEQPGQGVQRLGQHRHQDLARYRRWIRHTGIRVGVELEQELLDQERGS